MATISQELLNKLREDLTQIDINNLINALSAFKGYVASRPDGQINKLSRWTTSYNHILDLIEAHLLLLDEPSARLPSDIVTLLEILKGEHAISNEELLNKLNRSKRGRYSGPETTRELTIFCHLVVKEKH